MLFDGFQHNMFAVKRAVLNAVIVTEKSLLVICRNFRKTVL